jgi:hypothetical protein
VLRLNSGASVRPSRGFLGPLTQLPQSVRSECPDGPDFHSCSCTTQSLSKQSRTTHVGSQNSHPPSKANRSSGKRHECSTPNAGTCNEQISNTGPSGLDFKLEQNPLRLTNPGGAWLGLCEHVRQVVLRFRPNHIANLRRDGLTCEMECHAA